MICKLQRETHPVGGYIVNTVFKKVYEHSWKSFFWSFCSNNILKIQLLMLITFYCSISVYPFHICFQSHYSSFPWELNPDERLWTLMCWFSTAAGQVSVTTVSWDGGQSLGVSCCFLPIVQWWNIYMNLLDVDMKYINI